jgi:hypothetical protein
MWDETAAEGDDARTGMVVTAMPAVAVATFVCLNVIWCFASAILPASKQQKVFPSFFKKKRVFPVLF